QAAVGVPAGVRVHPGALRRRRHEVERTPGGGRVGDQAGQRRNSDPSRSRRAARAVRLRAVVYILGAAEVGASPLRPAGWSAPGGGSRVSSGSAWTLATPAPPILTQLPFLCNLPDAPVRVETGGDGFAARGHLTLRLDSQSHHSPGHHWV